MKNQEQKNEERIGGSGLKMPEKPRWTVLANIVSPEQDLWIGTSWEFFHDPISAKACYERLHRAGNCPCMRPYPDTPRAPWGSASNV